MNIVEYAENKYCEDIKQIYLDGICPICSNNRLSTRKNHIIPTSFHERFPAHTFTTNNQEHNLRMHKLVPIERLKNGLKIKGLWCDECENESQKVDDKFISFWDDNTVISNYNLIKFISTTCIRFYLYALKPHENEKTKEFSSDLRNILKIPRQRVIESLLFKQCKSSFTQLYPEIYVCRVENVAVSLLFPKLHSFSQTVGDQRISFFIGDMLFNVFVGSQWFGGDEDVSFFRFNILLNQANLTFNNFLRLNTCTKNISKADIPIITSNQMYDILLYN
ncbi:MAG: hypothetical protein KBD37_01130 [Burkholderiales bacterium]|nr:hypothetical protein [Burkholderiales bacterium]